MQSRAESWGRREERASPLETEKNRERAKPTTSSSSPRRANNPQAEHLLDWFHLTMRLTVMGQMAKGRGGDAAVPRSLAGRRR